MERILILMQLQDFSHIKHRGGMKNCFCFCLCKRITDIWESSHWELFCKKDVLKCVLDWEYEVFWIVKRRGALTKLGALLKMCLFAWDIDRVLDYNWRTNSKHAGKLGTLVKIYIFSRDNTKVFLCGICLIPEKMTLFFFYP